MIRFPHPTATGATLPTDGEPTGAESPAAAGLFAALLAAVSGRTDTAEATPPSGVATDTTAAPRSSAGLPGDIETISASAGPDDGTPTAPSTGTIAGADPRQRAAATIPGPTSSLVASAAAGGAISGPDLSPTPSGTAAGVALSAGDVADARRDGMELVAQVEVDGGGTSVAPTSGPSPHRAQFETIVGAHRTELPHRAGADADVDPSTEAPGELGSEPTPGPSTGTSTDSSTDIGTGTGRSAPHHPTSASSATGTSGPAGPAGATALPEPGTVDGAASAPDVGSGPAADPAATPAPAAAPVAAAPVAPSPQVGAARVIQAPVFDEVIRLAGQGNGVRRISLTLQPESLGEVRVVLSVRDGEVHVRLHAATSQARAALSDGSPDLVRLLETSGMSEAKVVVRDLPPGSASMNGHPPSHAATGEGQQHHAGTREQHPATDGTNDTTPHRGAGVAEPRSIEPVVETRATGIDVTV